MYYYLRLLRKKNEMYQSFFPHPSQANPSGLEKRLKWISQGSNSKICHHLARKSEQRKTGRIYVRFYVCMWYNISIYTYHIL